MATAMMAPVDTHQAGQANQLLDEDSEASPKTVQSSGKKESARDKSEREYAIRLRIAQIKPY